MKMKIDVYHYVMLIKAHLQPDKGPERGAGRLDNANTTIPSSSLQPTKGPSPHGWRSMGARWGAGTPRKGSEGTSCLVPHRTAPACACSTAPRAGIAKCASTSQDQGRWASQVDCIVSAFPTGRPLSQGEEQEETPVPSVHTGTLHVCPCYPWDQPCMCVWHGCTLCPCASWESIWLLAEPRAWSCGSLTPSGSWTRLGIFAWHQGKKGFWKVKRSI